MYVTPKGLDTHIDACVSIIYQNCKKVYRQNKKTGTANVCLRAMPADNGVTVIQVIFVAPLGGTRFGTAQINDRLSKENYDCECRGDHWSPGRKLLRICIGFRRIRYCVLRGRAMPAPTYSFGTATVNGHLSQQDSHHRKSREGEPSRLWSVMRQF